MLAVVGAAAAVTLVVVLCIVGYRVVQDVRYPLKYQEIVEKWSAEFDLDANLIYAVILTESGFDPEAVSSAGARGLMQMTEDTFDWVKGRIAPDEALVYDDMFQPEQAIRFGAYYMAISLERYHGDVSTAAAAYHSGWGTVDGLLTDSAHTENGLYLSSFPYKQMNHYVNKINHNYAKYMEIYA